MNDGIQYKKQGKIIHNQSRKMVSNVYKVMKKEGDSNEVTISLLKAC